MGADNRSVVRWQEELIRSHPEYGTNYPLKLKYLSQPKSKNGGRKRGSSNSGQVGRAFRASKRRTSPARGQGGWRSG